MRSWLLVWAVAGVAIAAIAEEALPSPSLEHVMARLAGSPGLQARFVEVRAVSLLTEPIETHGRIALAPPDRLSRITEVPLRTRLVFDRGELRFESEAEDAGDAADLPMARRFAEELLLLLGGDLPALRRRYELDFRAEADGWQLELVPRSARARRFVERLVLRGSGDAIASLEMQEPDGGGATTRFSELEMGRPLAPEELLFFFGRAGQP